MAALAALEAASVALVALADSMEVLLVEHSMAVLQTWCDITHLGLCFNFSKPKN